MVLFPADLAASNINLVGGDPYAGSWLVTNSFCGGRWPRLPSHRTPVKSLYDIGASTHPRPGLHGASGLMVAKALLSRRYRRLARA